MTTASRFASPSQPAAARDQLVDFFRGVCILSMIFTHLGQDTLLAHLSLAGTVGFFSGAEGFFFLSGLVFARVYRRRMLMRGAGPVGTAVAQRVFKLYRYHLACIGCVLIASWFAPQQLLALDESYGLFVTRPGVALLKASLLVYQPNLLDVLPLYIFYLPVGWWLIRAKRDASPWVPVAALALWALQQSAHVAFGRFVSPGAFNLLSYQVVFFLGLWVAHGLPAWVTARTGRISPFLVSCFLIAAGCFFLSHLTHLGVARVTFEQWAFSLNAYDKFSLGWLRLLDFIAVAAVLQQARPWLGWLPWPPIAALGRRSLGVFAGHVALVILFCGPVLKLRSMSTALVLLLVLLPVAALAFMLAFIDRRRSSSLGQAHSEPQRSRTLWTRLALWGCLLPVLACAAIAARAALREIDVDFTARPTRPTLPSSSPLEVATTVTLDSDRGDRLSAWWLAGVRGSPIVFVHGTDAARDQLLPEAEVLNEAGFSVLLLDLPGHGESTGKPVWGRSERSAIRAAIQFVSVREPGRPIGLFAFSAGAIVAAQAAATDERVRAVLLAGAPADFDRHIMAVYSKWGWLSSYPAIWAAYLAGYRNDAPTTVDAISKVARVFVVTGTDDVIVPPAESIRVFDAAREPKQLLRVPGAQHGNYMQVFGRDAYARALTAFFEQHLARRDDEPGAHARQ